MRCEVYKRLENEADSHRSLCAATRELHLQMLYGQCALEAERMKRIHQQDCARCSEDELEEDHG